MSWDIDLIDKDGNIATVENHEEGGTYALGGIPDASLNVTYNYGMHFDFKKLHKRKAGDTVQILQNAVDKLGTDRASDYWSPTKGNTGYACSILLNWAKQHPGCIWDVL